MRGQIPCELQPAARAQRALRRGAWVAWLLGAQREHNSHRSAPSQSAENWNLRIRSNPFLTPRVYQQVDGLPSPEAGRARPSAGGTSPVPLEMMDETTGGDDGGGEEGYTYPGRDPQTDCECLGAAHSKCRKRRRPDSVDWARASGAPRVVSGQLAEWLGVPADTLLEQPWCLCASCSDLFNEHRIGGAKKLRFEAASLECACCAKEKDVFGVPIPQRRFETQSASAAMSGDAWRTEWSAQGLRWNLQVQSEQGCVHGFNKFLAGDGAVFPEAGTNVVVSQYHTELIQDHCVSNPGLPGCGSLPPPSRIIGAPLLCRYHRNSFVNIDWLCYGGSRAPDHHLQKDLRIDPGDHHVGAAWNLPSGAGGDINHHGPRTGAAKYATLIILQRLYMYDTATFGELKHEFRNAMAQASSPAPVATAAATAAVAPAQIRVSTLDECTLTTILRSAGVQIVGFIAKDCASLIQPALVPLCLAKKSVAPHLEKHVVTDVGARRVGLVMRKEMKAHDTEVVIRQKARAFDAVGSNLGAEISHAEHKCPRSFRVLRTVGAALQTFDHRATAPEPVVLRGTASTTSETAAHDSRAFIHRQILEAVISQRTCAQELYLSKL